MRNRTAMLLLLSTCLAGRLASGQVMYGGEGHWWWEASVDGGATYRTGVVEVSPSQRSVLVRSMFFFPPSNQHYLGVVGLDAAVLGASVGDDIADAGSGDLGPGIDGFLYRLPGVLKLDGANDTLPPGQGPACLNIQQDPPWTFPEPTFSNPISVVDFRLILDGTAGDRDVSGFFAGYVVDGHRTEATVYSLAQPETHYIYRLSLVQDALTIRVLPAPHVFSILGASGLIAARRRR